MTDEKRQTTLPEPETLQAWFASALGQRLLQVERRYLEEVLPRRFGYHLMQLGRAAIPLYESCPIGHRFLLAEEIGVDADSISGVGLPEALPLASETIDVALLHHVLDFSHHQHQLLREVSRVLIAGGHLIILGFNPYSSWGLRRLFSWRKPTPWQADMLSPMRLTDWLKLLDFQVELIRFGMHSLPFNSARCIRYHASLDRLTSRLNWPTGGIYMISARKQVAPLTPIQRRWFRLPTGVGLPVADNVSGCGQRNTATGNPEAACRKS